MRSASNFPDSPSEGHEICGFCASLDDNDQPASSYRLPDGDAYADVLADIDDRISLTTTDMRLKVLKLLSYPCICSRHFYWFE